MIQRFFWIFVLVALASGGVFAQEEAAQENTATQYAQVLKAYIQPTFALGFWAASMDDSKEAGVAPSIELDFVNNFGLTLGLQNVLMGHANYAMLFTTLGVGYTYDTEKWSAGGKFMFVPSPFSFLGGAGGIGFDIKGTYWFQHNLGVSGILDIYFPEDIVLFSLRAGLSWKY